MKKRNFSLNKTVIMVLVVSYSVILVLLLCMDCLLIHNYQQQRTDFEQETLEKYVTLAGNDMENINSDIYDIYANNDNFNVLSGVLSDLEEFTQVYELDATLKSKVILEDRMQGYFIFYSAEENVRYFFDNSFIDYDDVEMIKSTLRQSIELQLGEWHWLTIEGAEKRYAFFVCRKGNVSIATIYSLQSIENGIENELQAVSAEVLMQMDDMYIENEELAEKVDFRNQIKGSRDTASYIKNGYKVYANRVKNSSIWVGTAIPVGITSYLNIPQIILLIVTAGAMALAFIMYRFLQKEMVYPLRTLINDMNRIKAGEWDGTIEAKSCFSELQDANETLNTMVLEIKHQKTFSYEQTIEKQRAQMQYLQLQLKPHFYLNGLKTLNVLAMNKDSEKMQELIMNLSYHLRYLLQVEQEFVPVTAEIDYVKNYVELKKNMTGRPFSITWNIGDDIRDFYVPTLCIQTFVENSFKYAKLGNATFELQIEISVDVLETEDGRFLDIRVQDNGAGYPETILQEINDMPKENSVSVGINNLKRRCTLLYKGEAEYYFCNDEGAVSELILPEKRKMQGEGK